MVNRREYVEGEIRALKSLLNETDYKVIKSLEGIFDCTSATGIIAFLKSLSEDVKEIAKSRAEWRKKVNEFEEELEKLDADGNERVDTTPVEGVVEEVAETGSGATQEAETPVEDTPAEAPVEVETADAE